MEDVASSTKKATPKPLLLTPEEITRIRNWVDMFLPVEYDREFVADTIIMHAWIKDIPHVSRDYVRHKCISAWRSLRRERKRNEKAVREGATRTTNMITTPTTGGSSPRGERNPMEMTEGDQAQTERKMLVEEAVARGKLSPLERRLIWMRFYDGQTLEEIASSVPMGRNGVSQAIEVALYKMKIHIHE